MFGRSHDFVDQVIPVLVTGMLQTPISLLTPVFQNRVGHIHGPTKFLALQIRSQIDYVARFHCRIVWLQQPKRHV